MTDLSGIQTALGGAVRDRLGDWLAELASWGPNQHTRLLRLHTPLGADALLAERATLVETLLPGEGWRPNLAPQPGTPVPTAGFGLSMLALSTRADLSGADLIGQPVLLELLTAHHGALRPFHGHVTRFELLGADGGYARYRLHVEPWLAFLAHRTDAWVFQNQSVLDITEAIFQDYAAKGKLAPQWRLDVADRAAFPRRSLCIQFQESDLAFLQRLWVEEGLFGWFEHTADLNAPDTLGQHTLVLADHAGAFRPNAQPRIRFTQASATLQEDSLTQWHAHRRLGPSRLHTASWDYRAVLSHGASVDTAAAHDQAISLTHTDQPGVYAYESPAQAERRARIQLEQLDSARKRFEGQGTVRTLQPGTTFTLLDHAAHTEHNGDADFVVLGVVHRARNNLSADAQAGLQNLLGLEFHRDEPVYQASLTAQRQHVPVRAAQHRPDGRLLHPKPTVWGTQTALVVGNGDALHTDRDGRIKVQFHWQRGAHSSHRLSPPADDNAPASATSGTWVRVAQSWAGANWGSVFIPRVGQEVIVAFLEGDIDRPVVIGAAYNGQGTPDGQGNDIGSGAAQATGNAPAWFPGTQAGHAHPATLSGFKSQSLDSSQNGQGAHNQLVFDDTPGQGRTLLHTTQAQTWLQMGHLLQQHDNQRLAPRGHGLELHTAAQGALRAGRGLHLSTHGQAGGTASGQGQAMASDEAQAQLRQHAELVQALHTNAHTHRAHLPTEPAAAPLPAWLALQHTEQSLAHRLNGEQGDPAATARPDLLLSASGAATGLTPAHTVVTAGEHLTLTAAQDVSLLAQRHHAWAVKDGISLFTRGEVKDPQHGVQDTGLKLHAATGNVNLQAQSGSFTLTAAQAVDMQSTAADIVISAPQRILLNGSGGYVKIEGGNIEIGTSGKASFLASMKELGGGGGASSQPPLFPRPKDWTAPAGDLFFILRSHSGNPVANRRYRALTGNQMIEGFTDAEGKTQILEGHIDQYARFELVNQTFDEHFILKDPRGEPIANMRYKIKSQNGIEVAGITDDQGRTLLFAGEALESLTLHHVALAHDEDQGGD